MVATHLFFSLCKQSKFFFIPLNETHVTFYKSEKKLKDSKTIKTDDDGDKV